MPLIKKNLKELLPGFHAPMSVQKITIIHDFRMPSATRIRLDGFLLDDAGRVVLTEQPDMRVTDPKTGKRYKLIEDDGLAR